MNDLFTGPPDPQDVKATSHGIVAERGNGYIVRMTVEDGTDAEAVEIECPVSGTVASTHPLDSKSVEDAFASYINLSWPAECRLEAVRARAEIGGVYRIGGDGEVGLYITEPPIRIAA